MFDVEINVLSFMRHDWPLTKVEQEIYQGVYYFHYKPMAKAGLSQGDIQEQLEPILAEQGWDWRRFEDYMSIDLMQRLVFEHSHDLVVKGLAKEPMTSNPEYRMYDPNYGALRLKNNQYSEDPDNLQ